MAKCGYMRCMFMYNAKEEICLTNFIHNMTG